MPLHESNNPQVSLFSGCVLGIFNNGKEPARSNTRKALCHV